jgi:hypothetical protein
MEKQKQEKVKKAEPGFNVPFGKFNTKLLLIGLGFLALGFLLMIGGGTDDPKVFSNSIFDFQRLTLAPILLIIGYIIEIFAIMLQPKEER